ncbi:MAG: NUDIX hydrolase [Candidatus Paceibacterota bacterium]
MNKETIKVEVVAGAIIKKDGKYLLLQEKQPRAYGLWNFPAGKVDVGESTEQAAIREVKEESGYDVELIRQINIFHGTATSVVKHIFEGKIIGGELKFPEDEIMDAQWFTFSEIKLMKDKLRSEWVLETVMVLENE